MAVSMANLSDCSMQLEPVEFQMSIVEFHQSIPAVYAPTKNCPWKRSLEKSNLKRVKKYVKAILKMDESEYVENDSSKRALFYDGRRSKIGLCLNEVSIRCWDVFGKINNLFRSQRAFRTACDESVHMTVELVDKISTKMSAARSPSKFIKIQSSNGGAVTFVNGRVVSGMMEVLNDDKNNPSYELRPVIVSKGGVKTMFSGELVYLKKGRTESAICGEFNRLQKTGRLWVFQELRHFAKKLSVKNLELQLKLDAVNAVRSTIVWFDKKVKRTAEIQEKYDKEEAEAAQDEADSSSSDSDSSEDPGLCE